ncbi:MAG TPA: hypothetical protein VMT11_21140 [Myxococcaceae bacterium]|nr:hypothetical protein [Myxococcaceae bacterium]
MLLLPRPLVAAGALVLGTFAVGCSHEHGPLADKPDTTSLGNAGRLAALMVSTSTGLAWRPDDPRVVLPGTLQGETSPLTTEAQPATTLFGGRADWSLGQTFGPETGWAMATWTSGPNLPVEPWNMALETPTGEGGGEGLGGPKSHQPKL